LLIDVALPPGHELSHEAPFELTATGDGSIVSIPDERFRLQTTEPRFPIAIPLLVGSGQGRVRIDLLVYYCATPTMRLCIYQSLDLEVTIHGQPGGPPEATVRCSVSIPSVTL